MTTCNNPLTCSCISGYTRDNFDAQSAFRTQHGNEKGKFVRFVIRNPVCFKFKT